MIAHGTITFLGKHVFCEKPLCITLDDVKECCDEAKRQNLTLTTHTLHIRSYQYTDI
jgi:predicted dehydrogenase